MGWGFLLLLKSIRNVQALYRSDRNINYEAQNANVENSTVRGGTSENILKLQWQGMQEKGAC